jgi:hypothetical protein
MATFSHSVASPDKKTIRRKKPWRNSAENIALFYRDSASEQLRGITKPLGMGEARGSANAGVVRDRLQR